MNMANSLPKGTFTTKNMERTVKKAVVTIDTIVAVRSSFATLNSIVKYSNYLQDVN